MILCRGRSKEVTIRKHPARLHCKPIQIPLSVFQYTVPGLPVMCCASWRCFSNVSKVTARNVGFSPTAINLINI